MASCCLQQILPQAAALSAGDASGAESVEQIHQLRIGLRRLRSALRLFARRKDTGVRPQWDGRLAAYARPLGRLRDLDVANPAGRGRPAARRAALGRQASAMLRAPEFQQLMLELADFAQRRKASDPPAADDAAAARFVRHRLTRFERRLQQEAWALLTEDPNGAADFDDRLHRLRKRLKRLRYGLELSAGLLMSARSMRGRARRRIKRLARAQEALGQYNDLRLAPLLAKDGPQRALCLHRVRKSLLRWLRTP